MIAWLEDADIEEDADYRTRYFLASTERRELRKQLKKSESSHRIQEGRAESFQAAIKEQSTEMEVLRREVCLHRTIQRLLGENDRLRRRRRTPQGGAD